MANRGATVRPHEKVKGVYWILEPAAGKRLATISQAPGTTVYGESVLNVGGSQFRRWDPYHSKLAAALLNGLNFVPLGPGSKALYLGAASGTTVSHVADIVGSEGHVYCVEFAQRSFRDLVNNVCRNWRNTTPLLEDARFPERYRSIVPEVDCIYCDIAQPDQTRIMADNLDMFLHKGGGFLLAVKSRSIDVTQDPSDIFARERSILEKRGYTATETVRLNPFELDHCMIAGKI